MIRLAHLCLPILLAFAAGCDETDAVAVRLTVAEDFSGTVRTSSLALPREPGLLEQSVSGAQWDSSVEVVCAAGRFAALADLALADIVIRGGTTPEGLSFVRIELPRGEGARWPRAFVPLTVEERRRAVAALDPSGRAKEVGATVKLEVELPSDAVGNGLTGRARGTRTKSEGTLATLTVPLDVATTAGDPIVWHLTWQR